MDRNLATLVHDSFAAPKDTKLQQQQLPLQQQQQKQQQKQRNKFLRSAASIGNNAPTTTTFHSNNNNFVVESSCKGFPATTRRDVMGGGFATPPPTTLQTAAATTATTPTTTAASTPTTTAIEAATATQMHEKVSLEKKKGKDKDLNSAAASTNRKEKTEKLKLLTTSTTKTTTTTTTSKKEEKSSKKDEKSSKKEEKSFKKNEKSSKKDEKSPKPDSNRFAEKLRRSFRRGEHKSLDLKRSEKLLGEPQAATSTTTPPQDSLLQRTGGTGVLPLQKQHSPSIFSLSQLPGLGCGSGGHINPALLLDSPEEATPPEYAYQHLSSFATTTNSSTSLESSFDLGERTSSEASISYWAWQQSNSSMGGEVSTNSGSGGAVGGSSSREGVASETRAQRAERIERENNEKEPSTSRTQLEKQFSSKSDTPQVGGGGVHNVASRSCSITSDSSSAKLTRLQNFLFKSSNESSTRSFQGHSNEAFTASSHNSSSGEWEQLVGGVFSSSAAATGDYHTDSFPEETTTSAQEFPADAATSEEAAAGSYYQYTLTSPNNPFLPEIIARSYHSSADENNDVSGGAGASGSTEFDANATAPQYRRQFGGGGGTHSAQLPTPAYSRAGSQESTHSEGGGGGGGRHAHAVAPSPSPASSSTSSTPGRQKRKMFSLNSPTRHLRQHPAPPLPPMAQQLSTSPSSSTQPLSFSATSNPPASGAGFAVRSLNPFLPISSKRAPLKQAVAVTSPIAMPHDLNAKREEFLRATMKICLVVSPPTSKLQLKSKSLTHLDGLDSMIACQHGAAGNTSASAAATGTVGKSSISHSTALSQNNNNTAALFPPPQQQQHSAPLKQQQQQIHHISPHLPNYQSTAQRPPTIYTQASQRHIATANAAPAHSPASATKTSPLSPTTTTTSCCNNRICCLGGGGGSGGGGGAASGTTPSLPQTKFQSAGGSSSSEAQHVLNIVGSGATPFMSGGSGGSASNICQHFGAGAIVTAAVGVSQPQSPAPPPASHKKKSTFMQRKKPLLTRSEVSSSEYFSVSFCNEQGCHDEEFIPATKGVTLLSALSQVLRRRNLSFSQINIADNNTTTPSFLDAGFSPLASSLDENTEVENLAGHHLTISERDGSRKMLQKAASFGSRTRPPRLLSSASTEETTDSAAVPGKQLKQRWSGLFGIKNPQQSQLCELLNAYAKMGVPQRSAALNFDHPDLDAALEYLDNMHKSWKDLVASDEMDESETRIQTAIWELVTTEVYYIHALQTVTDLFLACLEAVQDERLLTDVDQHRLFSNVRDICEANLKFWTLYLYPMVAHSIATREPLRIGFFQQGFVAFATIFAPYKKYCAEQSTCQFYCKELNSQNALFTSYLAWCESQKMCNRLRLADILVRPMQRLTKYSLLLAAIKKPLSDVDDIEAVDSMIHTVENFVFSVNNHLTTRQENERLKGVMARIESYDVVDTNNEQLDKMIKQYSQMFDLCAPMKGCPAQAVRHLFMEGDHRYKDNLGKADVHCFLLTDMLLVCKTIAKKGLGTLKVIRQPYLTDRLVVLQQSGTNNNILSCVYLNEFQVAVTAFTLQCSEAKNWAESLKRAKMIYTRLKQGTPSQWDSFRGFGGGGGVGGGGGSGCASGAGTADSLGVKKSPMNSSICSHVSSVNNSHSGSVEWNDSRNISVDFEKTNSLSSDEGSSLMGIQGFILKGKNQTTSSHKLKPATSTANTLSVQPVNLLGQSLPNLNLHHSHTNNTLLVPGTTTSHSGNLLLSPSHRGISYPPPSPTRVPLRRGMAFSTSTKNPPLVKTRNITSQNSINWHQIPATPTPTSPQSQHTSPPQNNNSSSHSQHGQQAVAAIQHDATTSTGIQHAAQHDNSTTTIAECAETTTTIPPLSSLTSVGSSSSINSNCQMQVSNETDV